MQKKQLLMVLCLSLSACPAMNSARAAEPLQVIAPEAINWHIEALASPNANTKGDAIQALKALGPQAAPATPTLIGLLSDTATPREDRQGSRIVYSIGQLAAGALAAIGKSTITALSVAIKSESAVARRNSIEALSKIQDSSIAEPLVSALSDDDAGVVSAASLVLLQGRWSYAEFPMKPFLEAAKHEKPEVRKVGLLMVGKIQAAQEADKQGAEALFVALTDTDPAVRDTSLQVLAGSRKWLHDNRAIEPLLKALTHENAGTRADAAAALSQYKDRRLVEPLLAQLKDPDPNSRANAAWALGKLGYPDAVGVLIERLKDETVGHVYAEVAGALGSIGEARALEPLFQALFFGTPTNRAPTGSAIKAITKRPAWEHPRWKELQAQTEKKAVG